MNRQFVLCLFSLCVGLVTASTSYAIFGVEDTVEIGPITAGIQAEAQASILVQWAEAIKKYEDQILKAEQQLQQQKNLVTGQSSLLMKIGDWKGVADRARSIQFRADQLKAPIGRGFNSLYIGIDAHSSPTYTNHGLFDEPVLTTQYQTKVVIPDGTVKRYAAIDGLHDDVLASYDQTDAKIKEVQGEISQVTEDIANAPTQAETEKCVAKLQGLKLVLDNLRAERQEKIARLMEAKAVNDSQADKERRIAELAADQEGKESVAKFGKN